MTVSQGLDILLTVRCPKLESHDLYQVHDLLVLHYLSVRCVADVEWLALEWEHTVEISTHNAEPAHREGLGGVSLGDDERAVLGLGSAGVVGVIKFCNASELSFLGPAFTLEGLVRLELCELHDRIDNARFLHCLNELVRKFDGAEGRRLFRHVFLGLRVESRIFNQTVYKHGQVVLDLVRLNLGAALVLLLHSGLQLLRDLVGDVIHVPTAFRCGNRIHK
mmetsp:Transcript_24179/g.55316  ORF Transcript_24179/g.55316 Transcript_24179/m.55316 type:complete len:221 (-) Transcript_24179:469-1131(-)